MAEYSQKWHNGTSRTRSTETSDGLAAIQAQLNNLGREIKKVNEKVYAAQVGCEQCKGGGYRATAPGFYQRNNTNLSYQELRKSMEDTLSKFMSESVKRHEENSNLIKEIRASTDAAIRNQGASIKNLEIQIGQMSKVLQERGFGSLPSSTEPNPRDHVKSISTVVEADSYPICRASVSVMPLSTYLNLGLGKLAPTKLTVELADRIVKYLKGIAENVLVEARLMGETLVLNRSLDPFFKDYIELNDLNVPLELRRDQVDDLIPTIKEGEVVEEFRAMNDARMVSKVFGYPSNCDHDKKIRMDCAYNLKFSCMIDFAVLEDMVVYRDEGISDVIFGESFLREVRINAKWFKGMITIYNGNEEVSEEDKMNGILHSYQKLKGFYKGVLNLGPKYVRETKMDEWSHAGTLACMRWNEKKAEGKSLT
ncbi:hypothetical protein Tco_0299635 [Tanacetum coccineum]